MDETCPLCTGGRGGGGGPATHRASVRTVRLPCSKPHMGPPPGSAGLQPFHAFLVRRYSARAGVPHSHGFPTGKTSADPPPAPAPAQRGRKGSDHAPATSSTCRERVARGAVTRGGYAGRLRRGAGCTVAGHGAHSGRYASRPTHAGALRAPAPHAGASALRGGADACAPPVSGFVRAVSRKLGPPAAVVEVAVWEVRHAGARARRGGVGDGAHVCKLQVCCRGAAALVLRRATACESAASRAARAGAGRAWRGRRRARRRRGCARAPRAGRGGQPGPPAVARGGPL